MATIPTIVDVRDAAGNSLVRANVDGTKPLLVVQLATGLIGTFTKSGDTGIVSIAIDPAAAQALGALTAASLEVTGAGTALLVDNDAKVDGDIVAGGDLLVGENFAISADATADTNHSIPLLTWSAAGPTLTLGHHSSGFVTIIDSRAALHLQSNGADVLTLTSAVATVTGGLVVPDHVADAASGTPATGWCRWASGNAGLYGKVGAGTDVRVLFVDPSHGGRVAIGQSGVADLGVVELFAATTSIIWIGGNARFGVTATGVGFGAAAASPPTYPVLAGSCVGNAGAYSVGLALIALGLATNGGTFTA